MTTHIEHAVSEVIPEAETSASGEATDTRWTEQEKVKAAMARWSRLRRRVYAEGLDD